MELSKNIFMVIKFMTTFSYSKFRFSLTCVGLLGPLTRERGINWIQRLEIAEDAARGM